MVKRNSIMILAITLLIAFAAMLSAMTSKKVNLHRDMVNASVMVYNEYGHGSGVFIDDNIIATAAHNLMNPDLSVELTDGTVIEVDDFYIDNLEDIGFIFVDVDEPYIAEVSLSCVDIGDTVYLVGCPYQRELKFTITKGILSHFDRDIENWKDLLQTDAKGAPGSSGGPLYNSVGNIIGICVASPNPDSGIMLCESSESILEAYSRCMESRNAAN